MSDNQHYITRAYLDRFIHPSTNENVLFHYLKGIGRQPAKGTKHLGSADCFYVQFEDGKLSNKIDEARKKAAALMFA